jgi:hypothetical protein
VAAIAIGWLRLYWRLYDILTLERSDLPFELLDLLPKFRDLIL